MLLSIFSLRFKKPAARRKPSPVQEGRLPRGPGRRDAHPARGHLPVRLPGPPEEVLRFGLTQGQVPQAHRDGGLHQGNYGRPDRADQVQDAGRLQRDLQHHGEGAQEGQVN